jgi:uncharacterized repeat protein (TIGR01451 family)
MKIFHSPKTYNTFTLLITTRLPKVFRRFALALAFALPTLSFAAAAPSYNGDFTASNTFSMSFNQAAGADQILIVRILYEDGLANPFIPSASYNGVPMTPLRSDDGPGLGAHVYYLLNPPVGNYTVLISAGGGSRQRIEAFSYSDVDQLNPFGAHAGATGSDGGAPFVSTIPFTPTSSTSTVVQLDWWQGAPGSGYAPTYGTARASSGFGMWAWHSSGFSDWNPPDTSSVSLTQSWAGGGTAFTSQAFELMSVQPLPTPTITPGPSDLIKSASAAVVMIGDTLTFCLEWNNASLQTLPMMVWDTVPTGMTYSGCDTSCTENAGLVNWSLGSQGPGTGGTVCFWGVVTGAP